MYENTNKSAINNIANKSFKAHKIRNIIGILAIILTTVLITTILTSAISFYKTIKLYNEIGKGYDGHGCLLGTLEQYQKVKNSEDIEKTGFMRKCSTTYIKSKEVLGNNIYLEYGDEDYFKVAYITPIEGNYPKTSDDIFMPKFVLDLLGLPYKLGERVTLNVTILENGKEVTKSFDFTLCGYYKEIVPASSNHGEVFTGEDFIKKYNPEMPVNASIPVKLKSLHKCHSANVATKELEAFAEKTGTSLESISPDFNQDSSDFFTILIPSLGLIFITILSGYFLIYNIFYISIANDIKFFGLLKTIGTSSKQIKSILKRQVAKIVIIAIPIGLIIGYLVGIKFTPIIISFTIFKDFKQISKNPLIFIFSALFSLLTVYISCRKPFILGAKISPIEAVKFTGVKVKQNKKSCGKHRLKKHKGKNIIAIALANIMKNPKKTIVTSISIALSSSIFIIVYNIGVGYNINDMVERYAQSDFRLFHYTARWSQQEPYKPIDKTICDDISKLPFVKDMHVYYMARTMPDYDELPNGGKGYFSEGEIKNEGIFKEEYEKINSKNKKIEGSEKDKNIRLQIMGVPEENIKKELTYNGNKIIDGKIDEEKLKTGDYFIYISQLGDKNKELIRAGDTIKISFYNWQKNNYVEKNLTVMAVAQKNDVYGKSNINLSPIILPNRIFKEIYKNYDELISYIEIDTKEGDSKVNYDKINSVNKSKGNFQVLTESKYMYFNDFANQRKNISFIGFSIAALMGLIAILNMVNTLVTNIISRKIEIACIQSIGMTKRQLKKMLLGEGLWLEVISIVITLPLSFILTYQIGKIGMFSGFNVKAYMVSVTIVLLAMLAMVFIIAIIMVKFITKTSIVERLREIV